jgi:hypothetical protein
VFPRAFSSIAYAKRKGKEQVDFWHKPPNWINYLLITVGV